MKIDIKGIRLKTKTDFVTNSSSASFILLIESTFDNLKEFNEAWNKFLNKYLFEHSWKISKKVEELKISYKEREEEIVKIEEKIKNGEKLTFIEEITYNNQKTKLENLTNDDLERISLGNITIENLVGNVFEVSHWSVMYNDFSDVPEWMRYLIIFYNMNPEYLLSRFGFKKIKFKIQEDND